MVRVAPVESGSGVEATERAGMQPATEKNKNYWNEGMVTTIGQDRGARTDLYTAGSGSSQQCRWHDTAVAMVAMAS